MSATIKDFFPRRKRIDGGEMNRSHDHFPSLRPLFIAVCALLAFTIFPSDTFAGRQVVGVDSVTAYIVKQTGNPYLMMSKEIDRPLSPASLTKIMTCMMAIESGRMDEVVTIPLEATRVEPTVAGFKPGDRFRLRDLVKAAMVNSSNDAAFAIALHLGGSIDGFVAMMNHRARTLGMNRTTFTNPAGYDRDIYSGNLSTARDLMILTERAIRYSEFNAIARMERAVFFELNSGRAYSLRTHNKLFDRYAYTVGIKTGYTTQAGPCLIARAEKDGRDMLIIMLNARTDRWSLASTLFDRGLMPGGYEQPVQVASSVRPEPVMAPVLPAVAVVADRARALELLKHKVVRQSGERSAVAERSSRAVAKSSIKSERTGRSGASPVLKKGRKGRTQEKLLARAKNNARKSALALKKAKKARAQEKKLLARAKKSGRKGALALKKGYKGRAQDKQLASARKLGRKSKVALSAGKKKTSARLAMKQSGKARQKAKAARKGSSRSSNAQARAKTRQGGSDKLSLSRKRAHSPNG